MQCTFLSVFRLILNLSNLIRFDLDQAVSGNIIYVLYPRTCIGYGKP